MSRFELGLDRKKSYQRDQEIEEKNRTEGKMGVNQIKTLKEVEEKEGDFLSHSSKKHQQVYKLKLQKYLRMTKMRACLKGQKMQI